MFGASAVDAVKESLDAANSTQGTINAFTFIDDDRATAEAEKVDAKIKAGRYAGPLAGKAIALKDLIDQEGHVTTCGSAFYRHSAKRSADCVTALEAAGGVIVGRTGLHEFAFGFSSENPHFGPVHNPWNLSTSPGGSSGGSAAAVAAGIVPIAIGTDTGGSVRVPAALCGTFGLKVTYGKIPLAGVFPLVASIDTVGPIADSMENIDIAYRAMSADNRTAELGALRIGIPQPWYDDSPTSDEIAQAFDNAHEALASEGHQVTPIEMPEVVPSRRISHAIAREVTEVHKVFRERGEPYGDDVATRLDEAEGVTVDERTAGVAWQQMIRDRFAEALESVDLLITPTVGVRSKIIGEDLIEGRNYRAVISYFSALVNHSLHPALAAPLSRTGAPPASIQVIGDRDAEPLLIEFGRSLEAAGIVDFRLASRNTTTSGNG